MISIIVPSVVASVVCTLLLRKRENKNSTGLSPESLISVVFVIIVLLLTLQIPFVRNSINNTINTYKETFYEIT